MGDLRWYQIFIMKCLHMTQEMVVSFRILTTIGIEHFLNTAPRDLFHSVGWSPGLILNSPKWNMISQHQFKCMMYTTSYVISSYLVQSTLDVRKLKYCVWARLEKRKSGEFPWWRMYALAYWTRGMDQHEFMQWLAATYLRCQAITQTHPDLLPIAIHRFQTAKMSETVINRF